MYISGKKGILSLFLVFALVFSSSTISVGADPSHVPVTDIIQTFPASMNAGTSINLTANVLPNTATNQNIAWSTSSPDASISGNTLFANINAAGNISVTATITNGAAVGTNFTELFNINVIPFSNPVLSVSITGLTAPVTGAFPVGFVGTSVSGVTANVQWQRQTGSTWSNFSGAFSASTVYRAVLNISTTNLDGFENNVTVNAPGGNVSGVNSLGDMNIVRHVYFPATAGAALTNVTITGLTVPMTGAVPVNVNNVNASQAGVNVTNVIWQRNTGGNNWVNFSGNFTAGAVYRAQLTITAPSPGFANNITVTAAGGTVTGTNNAGVTSITRHVQFPATAGAVLTNVTITGLTVPMTGAVPVNVNNVNASQAGVNVTNLIWQRNTGGNNWVNFSGNFTAGAVYRAQLTITAPSPGFANNVTVTAAGGTVTGTNNAGVTSITRHVQFPATAGGTALNNLTILGLSAPVTGAIPVNINALSANPSDVNITNVQWQRNTGGNNWVNMTGNFTAGSTYRAVVTITRVNPGFAQNAVVTAAGGTVTGTNAVNAVSTTRNVQFPATAANNITITGLTAPVTNAVPVGANAVNTNQTGVNVTNVQWQRNTGGNNWVNMTGNFTTGSTYRAVLTITTPNPGFALNQVFTAAGGTVTGTNNAGLTSITRHVQFPATGVNDTLIITGLTPPATGAMPAIWVNANFQTGFSGANVTNVQWQRNTGGNWVNMSGAFTGGSIYRAVLTIVHPNPAVGFIQNIPVTAAGGSVTGTNNVGAQTITRTVQFPATLNRNMAVTNVPITFNAQTGITVGGNMRHFDFESWGAFEVNSDGVSVLPARLAFSLLFNNADPYDPNIFVWNAQTSSFIIDPGGRNIVFQVGNPIMTVGGVSQTILSGQGANAFSYAPYVNPANSRMMLPLRAFADALNINVHWDAATSTVTLMP